MPKTSDGDRVICVGRESIEALATGEPVKVGDGEYLLRADSYDHPYARIEKLETALAGVISHWREFGSMIVLNNATNRDDYGFEERIELAAKLVPDRVA